MNVGILFPSSTAHPSIGFDLMNGLKLYMSENGMTDKINLISESVGIGGDEKAVYVKAEKLLMLDGVDVLLAYIDERVLVMLQPLLYASGKLAIIINPGANHPLNWAPQSNIIHLNLQHAFCCWLSGAYAAGNNNKDGLTATTFYDCGYLHAASMVKSFVKHGGDITYNYVNNDKYDNSFAIEPLTTFLSTEEGKTTGNALCLFDDRPAALLYEKLRNSEDSHGLKLYVSPMMLEQNALEKIGEGFPFSIEGVVPWKVSEPNSNNKKFVATYKDKNKKDPTIFSLLGWDTAMVLLKIITEAAGNYNDGEQLANGLKGMVFESPRGKLWLDEETNYFLGTLKRSVIAADQKNIEDETIEDYKKDWSDFINEPTGGAISGWTNTYLCY